MYLIPRKGYRKKKTGNETHLFLAEVIECFQCPAMKK